MPISPAEHVIFDDYDYLAIYKNAKACKAMTEGQLCKCRAKGPVRLCDYGATLGLAPKEDNDLSALVGYSELCLYLLIEGEFKKAHDVCPRREVPARDLIFGLSNTQLAAYTLEDTTHKGDIQCPNDDMPYHQSFTAHAARIISVQPECITETETIRFIAGDASFSRPDEVFFQCIEWPEVYLEDLADIPNTTTTSITSLEDKANAVVQSAHAQLSGLVTKEDKEDNSVGSASLHCTVDCRGPHHCSHH